VALLITSIQLLLSRATAARLACASIISFSKMSNDIYDILDKKPKLHHVIELMAYHDHLWEQIGQALQVRPNVLNGLKTSVQPNRIKLSDVIQSWFETRPSPVTWRNLIDCLDTRVAGGLTALADDIRKELAKEKYFDEYK
jgi:hypothetical protein